MCVCENNFYLLKSNLHKCLHRIKLKCTHFLLYISLLQSLEGYSKHMKRNLEPKNVLNN